MRVETVEIRLQKAAELLNYDWVEWDIENDCYTGHKTEENAEFVAWNNLELNQLIQILKGQSNVTQ